MSDMDDGRSVAGRWRLERGSLSEEELAALTVVLLAAIRAGAEEESSRPQGWGSRSRSFNPGAVRGAGWGGSTGR